jgi:hypothetical protein
MITSMDEYDPGSGTSSSAEDAGSSSKFDISADSEEDWVPPGPPDSAAARGTPDTPPSTPAGFGQPGTATAKAGSSSSSSSAKQQGVVMRGLTIKPVQPRGAPQTPYSVCKPPPPGSTKLMSAGPSASSIDVDAAVGHPGKAVIEVAAGQGMEPLDLVDVAQELQQLGG